MKIALVGYGKMGQMLHKAAKNAGGATAPNQGNCRGRASRDRDEPDATLKQASCGVILGARPSAVPGRLENRLRRLGKF